MNTSTALTLVQKGIQRRWLGKAFLILLSLLAVWRIVTAIQANPSLFLQQVVNGLQLGFVYALIALGYTMVYGVVRLINFAHGDVFMVGAFIGLYAIDRGRLPLPVVFAAAIVGCALLAVVIERVAYRPLRDAPKIAVLITAIGVSFFLEYFTSLKQVFGPNYYSFPRPFEVVSWEIGKVTVT